MPYVSKLLANRNLLKNLVLRDLRHRYVGSMGGLVWSVIHPLVQLVSYTFVFTVILKQPRGPEFGTDSFPIFLFCGLVPWMLFSDTVTRSCNVIVENSSLITKTVMPAEMLPLAIMISNLIHHAIGLGILFVVLLTFHSVHISAFGIFLYLPILVLLAQGLAWFVAGIQVFIRDTIQALQIVMLLWLWFTPIFYVLPENFRIVKMLNPMALIVTGYRNSLLNIAQPDPVATAVVALTSVVVFVVGGLIFKQAKPAFADVL